eukprot:jgi/Bigna1/141160/aug1.60_g15868
MGCGPSRTQIKAKDDAASLVVLYAYLDRIGISFSKAQALVEKVTPPNLEDLTLLLQKHITSVPFENLGQHEHSASEELKGKVEFPACAARNPSLHVHESLKKIVFDRRGGFCWEINFAFAWLLRRLGYSVRLGNSNVIKPQGEPVPGHLCIFVDGLSRSPVLVDPGFGDAPRIPIPVVYGARMKDTMIGDEYSVIANDASNYSQSKSQGERFDSVLTRSRFRGLANSPMVDLVGMDKHPSIPAQMSTPEAVYLFNSRDECKMDCEEFRFGLASVLTKSEQNFFSQKRFCFLATKEGYVFQGKVYISNC